MIKGFKNGIEREITRIPMYDNGVEHEGWEVRAQDGTILWGANKTMSGGTMIDFKGYGLKLHDITISGNMSWSTAQTPSPGNSVMPEEFGELTQNGYKIDINDSGTVQTVYLNEPLRKYGDYVDVLSTRTGVTRRIVKINLADLEWRWSSTSTYQLFTTSLMPKNVVERTGFCNQLIVTSTSSASSQEDLTIRTYESGGIQRASLRYDALNGDVSALYDFLNTGVWAWFVLEEPEIEPIESPTFSANSGSDFVSVGPANIAPITSFSNTQTDEDYDDGSPFKSFRLVQYDGTSQVRYVTLSPDVGTGFKTGTLYVSGTCTNIRLFRKTRNGYILVCRIDGNFSGAITASINVLSSDPTKVGGIVVEDIIISNGLNTSGMSVTGHIRPMPLTWSTITGQLPILYKADERPLTNWAISGQIAQSGTGSPTQPSDVYECGNQTANLVNVASEDLLTYTSSYNNFTIDETSKSITITGNALFGFIVRVNPNSTFTVDADCTISGCFIRVREYSSAPTEWAGTNYIQQDFSEYIGAARSFTTTANTRYIVVAFYGDNTKIGAVISNVILNSGSTPITYEPYGYRLTINNNSTSYPILMKQPIRKISTYSDILKSDNTISRKIVKYDLGRLSWRYTTGADYGIFYTVLSEPIDTSVVGFSNILKPVVVGAFSSMPDNSVRSYFYNTYRIALRYDTANGDVDTLMQMLSQGADYWTVLQNEVIEPISAPTINTLNGGNAFLIDTITQPSEASISGYIQNLNQ